MSFANPIVECARARGFMLLDGALATELEMLGCDLSHDLWSAKLLLEDPGKIQAVHRSYLEAGADCISTSSYQASIPAFVRAGLTPDEATAMLHRSVELAIDARNDYRRETKRDVLVAASLGPYGAALADGSEFTGNYAAAAAEVERFHRGRIAPIVAALRALGEEQPLLACETVPSLGEALQIARIVAQHDGVRAWISFSCQDERTTCEGQPIEACAEALEPFEHIIGVGVNCTDPRFVAGLVARLSAATRKPILAYPNSGERFDGEDHAWHGESVMERPADFARGWLDAGVAAIGGCCRTTPADIASLARLRPTSSSG